MGNAIRFGIYSLSLIFIAFCSPSLLLAQDSYVDTLGEKHEIKITKWFINQGFFLQDQKVKPIFIDEIQEIFRSQSEVDYIPYSSLTKNLDYIDFLLPSVESLRALKVDYFRDEHFEIWLSGQYVVYQVKNAVYSGKGDYFDISKEDYKEDLFNDSILFEQKGTEVLEEVKPGVVFLYHDSVGFNKIVAEDIEDDYFLLRISKYTFNPVLNDSIFSPDFKLKQARFLNFFDEEISPLTAIQYNDQDLADYYISSLRNDGALVVLLNLDKKKIDLYRNSGNTKLADDLEEKLNFENKMYAISFLDTNVFNFCKVYLTDAKNRALVLSGNTEGIFLNKELELDSSIVLEENFFLFARKGQVFETQLADQFNTQKKLVTSNPVIQDAMVIYDTDNVQLLDPFPFFIRTNTAGFGSSDKVKVSKKAKEDLDIQADMINSRIDPENIGQELMKKNNLEKVDRNFLLVAYGINQNFYKYYFKTAKHRLSSSFRYNWNNNFNYSYTNSSWIKPNFIVPNFPNPNLYRPVSGF